ncbi:tryptophanyl-tRNA synthetase [Arsukibacterium ikkense]|uniref:Tryptophanyl-tRNA synthetase n=1 Tax=Arsukibacterium ikkense TaxID=336831 RepID=A0A0M2V8Z3_9GAMM|nr:SirB2 family protein [Arsukibacterium ikkense]KKO46110.1 tryptophanyl-tRNA synthetase [Arsukibacterium ikkense]
MYLIIKHTHLTIIALTLLFFLVSFALTLKGSDKVNNKLLKIGPHILYTLFIVTAIYLMVVNPLQLYPFVNGWASSKLAGFVIYVLSITLALKWAKTTLWRLVGFVSALFWFGMTARLAYAHRLKVKGAGDDVNAYIDILQSIGQSITQSMLVLVS